MEWCVLFTRLARTVVRRRRLVALAWLALFLAGSVYGGRLFDQLGETEGLRPDAESVLADGRLDQLVAEGPLIVAVLDGRDAYDPAVSAGVSRAVADLGRMPGVVDVDSFYTSPGGQVAPDNRASVMRVELVRGLDETSLEALEDRVGQRLRQVDVPRVLIGGEAIADREFADQAVHDLARGELIAFAVLLALLLAFFGGVIAAGLPLLVAAVAVSGTLLALLALGHIVPVSEYSVNVVTLLGLGLAVDYSLLIVARFRQERAAGLEPAAAVERVGASACRTVAFSGLTVAVALAGLLVFAEPLLRSMAVAGAVVVVLAALVATTLVPALLAMWGARIRPPRTRAAEQGLLYRLSRLAQRRAQLVAPLVALGLIVLAAPFARANLEDSGPEALPRSSQSRQVDEQLRDRFGGGVRPVTVIVDTDDSSPEFLAFINRANALPGVRTAQNRPDVPEGHAVIDVTPEGTAAGPVARRLVGQLRALSTPFGKQVTGPAAKVADYRASVASRLPAALAVVVVATFVLLFLMTGSLVVPAKAIVMSLLSLAASLGVLVWIFQDGHLSGLLGFDPVGAVDLTIPVLVLIFTFGLSMDYELFLLARISEAWEETGDNDHAVAAGIAQSGRVVTAAAACIITVFGGFAIGQLLPLKALGVGMAIAVLLDVTVVRGLLLPASMRLLGEWNWWAPPALARLRRRLSGSPDRGTPLPPARPAALGASRAPPPGAEGQLK
jgi:putative drug exporter of the RND superfamily